MGVSDTVCRVARIGRAVPLLRDDRVYEVVAVFETSCRLLGWKCHKRANFVGYALLGRE